MQVNVFNGKEQDSLKENSNSLGNEGDVEHSGHERVTAASVDRDSGVAETTVEKQNEVLTKPIQNMEESVSGSESSILSQVTKEVKQAESPAQALGIGNEESRDINRFKIIVILILLAVAVVSSSCVVLFIKKAEQNDFEDKFHNDALKLLESIRNSIDNTLIPLDNLAGTLVSHAKAQNTKWPFVTLEDYGVRIAKTLPLTDAIWITVLPVVTPENRPQWENYSRTHDDWLVENFSIQDTWELYYGPKNLTFDAEAAAEVTGNFGVLEANTRYAF